MTTRERSKTVYLNVTVHDASMAVKDKVSKKFNSWPKPVQNQAAKTASYFSTPKKAAQMLSQRLCEELPEKLRRKGISVEMEEIFREGAFVVLRLKVLHVDTQAMDKNWLQWFTNRVGQGFKDKIEDELLPNLVTKQLTVNMPAEIDERMASKKITAETIVNNERKQAQYFEAKVEEIRAEEEARKNAKKNPLRRLKRSKSKSQGEEEDEEANLNTTFWLLRKRSTSSTSADEIDKENEKMNNGDTTSTSSSRWNLRRRETPNSSVIVQ